MRLQVFLSHNGVCSRRDAMTKVQEGHVRVNGDLVTEPSFPVDPFKDTVQVDGVTVQKKDYAYILLNKPVGYVTTTEDEHAGKTVMELLPAEYQHLNPVGRLDKDTEGLLLLTNDGDVAYALTHPKFDVEKTYFVMINGVLSAEQSQRLENGVMVEGKLTAPAKIRDLKTIGSTSDFEMTIHEGRKRQIRLMLEAVGHKVEYLMRISQGPLELRRLKVGQWRKLTSEEITGIKSLAEGKT